MMRKGLLWVVLLVLSGCAIKPGPSLRCDFRRYELSVADPFGGSRLADAPTLAGAMRSAAFPPGRALAAPSPSMLFLSGGSLHGAFGAGYLDEWRHRAGGRLPAFSVVTGISTGAILSTFAFTNRTEVAVDGYSIERESELLRPIATIRDGKPTTAGYLKLLKRGALADLAPLRVLLTRLLSDDILLAVAAGADEGRLLVIGVVDVDTGQAAALDLTQMAKRFRASTGSEREAARACYAEGIIASSSAPLAALPVFIDDRMYIDGGARFGMFSDELGAIIPERSTAAAAVRRSDATVYLIANGDQEIAPRCGRQDTRACENGNDPPGASAPPHGKWSFLELALRSESILANQVYRFSADSISTQAQTRNFVLHAVKIAGDMPAHSFALDDPNLDTGTMTCADWRKRDRVTMDPIQFYPRYMRCLIDYGRMRARKSFPAKDDAR